MTEKDETKKRSVKGSRVVKDSSPSDDTKASGKRGRPRVDAQDQSAVERRRTQIRLAQRAYRERKETTINDLEKRVADMQKSLDEVRTIVTSFRDRGQAASLHEWNPVLAMELLEMSHQVVNLTGSTDSQSGDFKSSPPDMQSTCMANSPTIPGSGPGLPPVHRPSLEPVFGTEQSDWLPTNQQPAAPIATPMGYTFTYNGNPDQPMEMGFVASESEAESADSNPQALQRYSAGQINPQFDGSQGFGEQGIPYELKPVYTYNFQETSFARRLTRESYERSYHMLTNPHTPPEKIHRMLQYSLCFGNIKRIAERIKMKLMRSKYETLETWDLPVLHVGGAGLHYPREDVDGLKPEIRRDRGVGPFPISRAGKQAPSEYFPYEIAKWIGLEGVWYDAYDVEAYLRSRGLILDGSSSTAIVEIDESQVPGLEGSISSPHSISTVTTTSTSGPQSPMSAGEPASEFFAPHVEEILANLSGPGDFGFDSPMTFEEVKEGDTAKVVPTVIAGPQFQPVLRPKRKVIVDVDRLIDALNQDTVCLGRSPGYNEEQVKRAFDLVITEAY